tara:strand:+ start:1781 stop:2512 length:732 start_codon:yes stop_codon:yes gene_type:complete
MNLRFNKQGDIDVVDASLGLSLNDVEDLEAEISRFFLFFDTKRGGYKYSLPFGNNSDSLVGLSGVEMSDVLIFNEQLNQYLESSDLFSDFTIVADFIDQQTIKLELLGGNVDPITWKFSTKTGRLTKIQEMTPDKEFTFVIHSREWKSNGSITYSILDDINKLKEINDIGLYEELLLSHRLFIMNEAGGTQQQIETYQINDIAGTLDISPPPGLEKWIRIELWPSNMANLEATSNPYLIRRNS